MKICSRCKQSLALSEYGRNASRPDGLHHQCRECRNIANRESHAAHRDERLAKKRADYAANRARVLAERSAYRVRNLEKVRARNRAYEAAHPETGRAYRAAYRASYPEVVRLMHRVGASVRRAVANGRLVKPAECSECSTAGVEIQAAHSDYSKPLDVRWLCRSCHTRWDHAEPKLMGKRA